MATAAFADGPLIERRPGDLFFIPPEPHDSWVVGDEPNVSLHLLGMERYATSHAKGPGSPTGAAE